MDHVMVDYRKINDPYTLDIYLYFAHEQLAAPALKTIIDCALLELEWAALPANVFLIAPESEAAGFSHPDVTTIRHSDALSKFATRWIECESTPRDMLVCFGAAMPPIDVIGRLQMTLREDYMASAVAPRIAIEPFGHLVPIYDQSCESLVSRARCSELPPIYYLPEDLLPCICISQRVVANIDLPTGLATFPEAILGLLRSARRRGLLLLVDNRAIVSLQNYKFNKHALVTRGAELSQLSNDHSLVECRLANHPAIAQELRMKVPASYERSTTSLLLDCTNMPPIHNGTTECALGIMRGINANRKDELLVSAMVPTNSQSFFSLEGNFPTVRFVRSPNGEQFDVAIRLSQAWSISNMKDLCRCARSVAITILDSIGPDTIYPVQADADSVFQFVGEHADGVLYDSEFTRRQFRRRYFVHPDVIESVIYYSLDPEDYVPRAPKTDEPRWILVFGNSYDHKDIPRTLNILAAAFPFEQFKVVGMEHSSMSNVEGFFSGNLHDNEIDALYQGAKFVIIPSFYEGFGFPVVRGLAYGKTVIVRQSELWHEIARNMPGVGRLIEFTKTLDLVEILALLLRGEVLPCLRLGASVSAKTEPHNWQRVGEQIIEFAKRLRESEKPERWLQRDRALRYIYESSGR